MENNEQSFLDNACKNLIKSRPTAINLKWAVDRMYKKLKGVNSSEILNIAVNEANQICEEDVNFCKNIGIIGQKKIIHSKVLIVGITNKYTGSIITGSIPSIVLLLTEFLISSFSVVVGTNSPCGLIAM